MASVKLVCVDCKHTDIVDIEYDITENSCYQQHHNLWVVENNNFELVE